MKFTGITRPLDELGRIVIPKEIRKALELKTKDELEIFIEDGSIVLKKQGNTCALCGSEANLSRFGEKFLCSECALKIRSISDEM